MISEANDKDTKLQLNSPPNELPFWELFDFFWARGLGNEIHKDGTPTPWTATLLETAFDGSPDIRSIENWQSRTNMPSPENIRKLSWIISGGDADLRKAWHAALISARLAERRRMAEVSAHAATRTEDAPENLGSPTRFRFKIVAATVGLIAVFAIAWYYLTAPLAQAVQNIRICDAPYFDAETKKCSHHVSVFVHGLDEVFLSFDFEGVPDGTPFDRWWILNGERVAGRTSFNDDAWPGYTYWRPGVLSVGQYVVRIVVDGEVFTQTFFVQADGLPSLSLD
jgi:hypothetical protein